MTSRETLEEKVNTQERILLTAEQVYAQKGYAGTRVSDIAERAEVNVALISYYFESKEKLYHGVLDRLFHNWEAHVHDMSWDDDDPEKVLSEYIHKHFEFKWSNMNMFRIFQWESLSDAGIYREYVRQYWEKDFQEKLGVLKRWKRQGLLNPYLNENVVLALLWGMMDRLLFSKEEELRLFLGMREAGFTLDEMRKVCSKEIMGMAFYGMLPRREIGVPGHQPKEYQIRIVPLDEQSLEHTEVEELILSLSSAADVKTMIVSVGEQLEPIALNCEGLILVLNSEYGEISASAQQRLKELEAVAERGELSGLPVGLWVIRGDREAQNLQSLLEQQLGRMGMYPLQRLIDQSSGQFGKRFAQYMKRLQPCDEQNK
ncbi:TetR/AcrR family transcriptional regulator [Cohnella sp. WQ 127256]|uniref:TetR/AcrR family transcriptional regulator n=1 Tax=Cohnella sp. WQ 127256 TaxID=2938790 RepID=UPI0021197F09|nr:TetR/AcrR family transcriptional regulator [Cohnella sp. WQ 127256]